MQSFFILFTLLLEFRAHASPTCDLLNHWADLVKKDARALPLLYQNEIPSMQELLARGNQVVLEQKFMVGIPGDVLTCETELAKAREDHSFTYTILQIGNITANGDLFPEGHISVLGLGEDSKRVSFASPLLPTDSKP